MKREFWVERWKNKQIGFHQNEINPYLLKYCSCLDIAEGGVVFVPLCGKTNDIIWLAEQGYKVVGIELSQIAIEEFFHENSLEYETYTTGNLVSYTSHNITLYHGDLFDLSKEELGNVSAVFDRAALIALPESMRESYFEHIVNITNKAVMLLITMEYDQNIMSGPPFSVPESEINKYYSDTYCIQQLGQSDLLLESTQFSESGLKSLIEKVFKLTSST